MSYPYHSDHPNATEAHESNSTPELPEIQQEDPSIDVKGTVEVANVVRTQELPSRIGTSRSYLVSDTDTVPMLGSDLRRKRVTLFATSVVGQANAATGFYVGEREDVRSGNAAFWPVNQALVLCHTEQIFVRTVTGTSPSTALISVIAENWAD
jgi:hypothetical protein